jgi:hypothetical protein
MLERVSNPLLLAMQISNKGLKIAMWALSHFQRVCGSQLEEKKKGMFSTATCALDRLVLCKLFAMDGSNIRPHMEILLKTQYRGGEGLYLCYP